MLDHMLVLDLHKRRHKELVRAAERDRQAQASKRANRGRTLLRDTWTLLLTRS